MVVRGLLTELLEAGVGQIESSGAGVGQAESLGVGVGQEGECVPQASGVLLSSVLE